jgi:hypothetical protein
MMRFGGYNSDKTMDRKGTLVGAKSTVDSASVY